MKKILQFYYHNEDTNYGLKLLFQFEDSFLIFDSVKFEEILNIDLNIWSKIEYSKLDLDAVFIEMIREDELTSYFIKLSNKDIIYIYQEIVNLEEWFQNFKIVAHDSEEYFEVCQYMNEDWVENVFPIKS